MTGFLCTAISKHQGSFTTMPAWSFGILSKIPRFYRYSNQNCYPHTLLVAVELAFPDGRNCLTQRSCVLNFHLQLRLCRKFVRPQKEKVRTYSLYILNVQHTCMSIHEIP